MAARILFVTGKGGSGKSTLSMGLAFEARQRGRRVLLLRFAGSTDRSAKAADRRRDDGIEQRLFDDTRDLEAFLTRILGFGFLARRLQSSSTFSAVATAAPGLRDLIALTTIAALARRRSGLLIVDAPSSGHSLPLLSAPSRVLGLVRFGPVAREAELARGLLADPAAFEALLVASPEEFSINELRTLREELRHAGVARSRVIVNGCWPDCTDGDLAMRDAIAAASPDAASYLRRQQRQSLLLRELEAEVGATGRVSQAFDGRPGSRPDLGRLLDAIDGDASMAGRQAGAAGPKR